MVCVLLSITVVAFGVVGATTDWGNNATPKTDDKPLQESNSSDMSAQESSDSFTEMYSSNENGSNEILFNDIPYGARYNEVIPVLEKKSC